MKLDGHFEVEAPIEEVWQVFLDPERLCTVMPGCEEATRLDETHYEAVLAAKVQFMTVRARMAGELLEAEEPSHLVAEFVGETLHMAGAFRGRMSVFLSSLDNRTHAEYAFDITMLGRLGSLGEPIVRSTAQKLADQFADNVTELFRSTDRERSG